MQTVKEASFRELQAFYSQGVLGWILGFQRERLQVKLWRGAGSELSL